MIGILLASFGTFFEEISNTIAKKIGERKGQSLYLIGFLHNICIILILLGVYLLGGSFHFSAASWPTFSLRVVLEVLQAHITILALIRADRSTFSFFRILTIPLLLIIDIWQGYLITTPQYLGIGVILTTVLILILSKKMNLQGLWLVMFTAVNAALTISLYKFNITHYNSVIAEQGIIIFILAVYFFVFSHFIYKEKPLLFFRRPIQLLQSSSIGLGGAIGSFAYAFAPASIILSATRASALFWAILSGRKIFLEKNFYSKISLGFLLVIGLILLIP